jgi:hypothetical protein
MINPYLLILVALVALEFAAFWVLYYSVKVFLETRKTLSKSLRILV